MHAVRVGEWFDDSWIASVQKTAVIGVTGIFQRGNLLLGSVEPDLAVMLAGSTDRIAGHHMIDDISAALGNPPVQADRAVGIEGLALEPEVVGGDLGQIAAEGMAGDGNVGGFAVLADFCA